jgi:ABC-type branched-subunit amino acid transport system ATPase component/ABC-type branched-subunit amino acid transport system permease subunit
VIPDLDVPLEVVILGVIAGLTYALLGVGLVIVYKTSRVINFAHGEMGALAATIMPVAVILWDWPYWVALPISLAAAAACGAATELVVIRRLVRAPRLIVLVATIGASQLFYAAGALVPKEDIGSSIFPTPFDWTLTIGSLRLTSGHLLILIAAPLLTLGVALFLQRTKLGLASRAAAENSDAARLAGIPVRRVSLVVWTIAGLLAGASAILVGPTQPVVTRIAVGPGLMLKALTAAMMGGLVSIPAVFAGGIAIGIIEAVVRWNYPTGGVFEITLFLIVVGSMLTRRALGVRSRGGEITTWSLAGAVRPLPAALAANPKVRTARRLLVGGAIALAVSVPLPLSNAHRVLATSVVLFATMGLSLVILTGYAGQVSLGQFAFVGLGALVGGRMHQLGYAGWMCILYAVIAGGLAALVIGLPALRIRGLFLAVTTLGFAVAANGWLYKQPWLAHVSNGLTSLEIPRSELFGIDLQNERNFYWVCLGVFVVCAFAVAHLRKTGIGRAMAAVRDNEPSAATLSVSPRRVKLLAFVLAGMLASLAGYFYGALLVNFEEPTTFMPELSIALVAMVILGGVSSVTGAILGALWLRGLGYVIEPLLPSLTGSSVALLVSGVGLLVAVLQFPGGIAAVAFMVRDRVVARLTGEHVVADLTVVSERTPRPTLPARAVESPAESAPVPALEARAITVHFGGITAVDGASLRVDEGEIVGLMGPNGAGKTTLFDVLSGHHRNADGQVFLRGVDVTGLRPEELALRGLGRTFQQARLFDEMTLLDACKVALERDDPSEVVPSVLGLPPSRDAELRKTLRAEELLELLGLSRFGALHVAELSTGMRRLAELGCLVGLGADVLLLDEPTAGIAQREVEAFRPVLRELRAHLGASMLVIEHDIPLMMGLVDRLYVLANGKVIAEGAPAVLRDDPAVVAAYLGTDERAIARSGSLPGAR